MFGFKIRLVSNTPKMIADLLVEWHSFSFGLLRISSEFIFGTHFWTMNDISTANWILDVIVFQIHWELFRIHEWMKFQRIAAKTKRLFALIRIQSSIKVTFMESIIAYIQRISVLIKQIMVVVNAVHYSRTQTVLSICIVFWILNTFKCNQPHTMFVTILFKLNIRNSAWTSVVEQFTFTETT